MRRKYMVLFLTAVNRDQEDALSAMKFSRMPSGQQAFDLLDLNTALGRLIAMRPDPKGLSAIYLPYMRPDPKG